MNKTITTPYELMRWKPLLNNSMLRQRKEVLLVVGMTAFYVSPRPSVYRWITLRSLWPVFTSQKRSLPTELLENWTGI
jgi:hypothetical protein